MSKKWIPMIWKGKDSVFVNKKSWSSQSGLVQYKYDTSHSKVYKGSRSNFSPQKNNSKSKKKTSRHVNAKSNSSLPKSPTSPTSPTSHNNQKVKDFLTIATTCNVETATSLLRSANWNVQNAIEFYFKYQTQLITNTNPSNPFKKHTTKSVKPKQAPIKYGKAGTRSETQKRLVKEKYDELFASFGDNEIICFTDGACKGNPGPAGSGCVILYGKKHKSNYIQRSFALGIQTNNIAELYAIGLSLHIIQQHPSSNGWIKALNINSSKLIIRILSDSQYCIGVLSKNWKIKKNKQLIGWIKKELDLVCKNDVMITFHWVGGHSGVDYNEMADSLANTGVAECVKNKKIDVTKAPNLFRKNTPLKRPSKKRKFKELYDTNDGDIMNDTLQIKKRKLNENTNNKMSITPPQSPTIL